MILIDYFARPSLIQLAISLAHQLALSLGHQLAISLGHQLARRRKLGARHGGKARPLRGKARELWGTRHRHHFKKAFGVDDRRRDATMVDHVRTSRRPAVAVSPKAWKRGNHVSHT